VTRRILLAGGGTGGHIYPGLAVCEALGRLDDGVRMFFAVTGRAIDRQILSKVDAATMIVQPIVPFSARFVRFAARWLRSYRVIMRTLRDERIDAVLGLGGFGSSAALAAAGRLGVKRAIFNPDAVPGRANRLFGKRVDEVFVQWESSGRLFDRPVRVVGCPLRSEITQLAACDRADLRREAIEVFELDGSLRTVFVWGGSTGARSVNQAVMKLVLQQHSLPDDVQILHMTGAHDFDQVRRQYSEHHRLRHCVVKYVDRPELALTVADVVVGRAGAVALAELSVAGVPAVLMPYPYHRDHHQRANAMVLVEAGGAVLVDDDGHGGQATVAALTSAIRELLDDPAGRERMSQRLIELSKPNADEEIARWLIADQDTQT